MASRRLVCVALCVAGWLRGSATTSAAAAASVAVPPRWIFPEPGASLLLLCDALDVSVESTGGTWCVTVVRDGAAGGGTRACVAAGASVRVGGVDVGAYTAVACVGDACATTSFEVALRGHPQARVAAMLEDAGLVAAAAVVRRAPDFALAPAAAVHPPLAVRFITPLPGSSLPLSSTLHVHMGTSNETERAPLRFCVSRVLLDGAFVSALPLVLPPPQGCIDAGIYDGYLTGFGPGVHGIAVLTVLQDLTAATWTAVTVFSVGIDRPSALQSARPLALGNAVDAGGVEASAGGEAFGPPGAAAVTEGWLRALAGGYAPEMAPPRARFAPPVCARAFLVIIVGVHEMTPWDVWTVGEALHAALRALECVSVLATAPRGVLLDMASVSEELRGRQVRRTTARVCRRGVARTVCRSCLWGDWRKLRPSRSSCAPLQVSIQCSHVLILWPARACGPRTSNRLRWL